MIIELKDGIAVEVDASFDQIEQVGNAVMQQVEKSLNQIGEVSQVIVRSISESLNSFTSSMSFQSLEVEYGLSFTGEGNVYIAKLSTSTSVKIKLALKPVQTVDSRGAGSELRS